MTSGLLSATFWKSFFHLGWRRIAIYLLMTFCTGIGFYQNGNTQDGPLAAFSPDSLFEKEKLNPHLVWYIPGANVGSRGDTNLFTLTYCHRMREIMASKFLVLPGAKHSFSASNVMWALWHAQHPLRNPARDKRIRNCLVMLASDSIHNKSNVTLVSSSFGSVVAAQLALYLINNPQSSIAGPEPINLVFGCSMLSKESQLFRELEKAKMENKIGSIVYDELQYPGDNVTGMCGTTRLHAITEVCRIAFPFIGRYRGQPSILNKDPMTGHIHRKREITADKANDYILTSLVDHSLAGDYFRTRAVKILSR